MAGPAKSVAKTTRTAAKPPPVKGRASAKGAKGKGAAPAQGTAPGKGKGKGKAALPTSKGRTPAKASLPARAPKTPKATNAAPNTRPPTRGDRPEVRISTAEFAAGAAKAEQIPEERVVEIAFAGRSNVGKSSLLNMMLARRGLARTSNTPGCTRQINFFDVKVASGPEIAFVDLPGYGYAKVSKSESQAWKKLLESYLQERATLRAVVVLVDVRRGLEQEERDLIEFLGLRPDLRVVIAVTKLDKLPRNQQKPQMAALARAGGVRVIGTSAETKQGREELWAEILKVASTAPAPTVVLADDENETAGDAAGAEDEE